jgi:hypothetical protein
MCQIARGFFFKKEFDIKILCLYTGYITPQYEVFPVIRGAYQCVLPILPVQFIGLGIPSLCKWVL